MTAADFQCKQARQVASLPFETKEAAGKDHDPRR